MKRRTKSFECLRECASSHLASKFYDTEFSIQRINEFQPVPSSENLVNFDVCHFDDLNVEQDESGLIFEPILPQSSQTETADDAQSSTEDQLFELMKSEEMRLKTFDTWPRSLVDIVKPADLAQCGYFFTTIRDRVICAFCKVPAWNWEVTDVPIKEHYKHNRHCPLLNDQDCGNRPIKTVLFKQLLLQFQDIAPNNSNNSNSNVGISFFPGFGLGPPSDNSEIQPIEVPIDLDMLHDLSKLVLTHKPAVKFYTFNDRLKTFDKLSDKWPLVNRNRLADAGFYFLERDDQVKCFSCGLIIRDWSNGNDPWIEHCKHHSNCEYLNLRKGREFVIRYAETEIENGSDSEASSVSPNSLLEIQGPRKLSEKPLKNACKICLVEQANVIYLLCTHLVSCASCTMPMRSCAVCRQDIKFVMNVYLS